MKKLFLIGTLACALFAGLNSQAQVRFSVNIGLPVVQQPWYDDYADYYYMPDQDCYYNVNRGLYVFLDDGRWVCAPRLPQRFGGFGYRDVRYYPIHGRAPFMRGDYYRQQYARGGYYNNDRRGFYGGGDRRGFERHDNGNHRGWEQQGGRGFEGGRGHGWRGR